jgi:hypothetical protein
MKKDLLVGVAWGGAVVLVALTASFLRSHGYIDQDTAVRVVAMNGLMIAYYGNLAPKAVVPNAYVRQVKRVAGWALVLSGVVYAGFWAFAPLPLAMTIGTGSVAAGIIVTVSYCFWLRAWAGQPRDTA